MISVIIPLYNAGNYICDAVASVLKQDVEKELIIVDDASTDDSPAILKKWLYTHASLVEAVPVHLVENAENLGVAKTRNKGVQLAQGDYIAYLDADDMFAPHKLEKQLACLQETGASLCNTARVLMEPDGRQTRTVIHTPERITLQGMERSNRINCSSVLLKRDVALRYPMEHSEVHEDYLTWLRMLQDGVSMVGIDEPLLLYRLSEGGKSRNKWKSARMTYRTYLYAGYGRWKSGWMLVHYMINGIRKYSGT